MISIFGVTIVNHVILCDDFRNWLKVNYNNNKLVCFDSDNGWHF